MTRRSAKLVVLYLLLGLVATWAVAWGSAMLWRPANVTPGFFVEVGPAPHRQVMVRRCPGGQTVYLSGIFESEAELDAHRRRVKHWELERRPIFDVPRIRLAPTIDWIDESDPAGGDFAVVARGWPRLALQCRLWNRFSGGPIEAHHAIGIPSSGPAADKSTDAILLPYLPYGPGLIADTLFYAALLAGLHQLVGWGRRTQRRKRGRCVGCGYDLSGLDGGACPECGSMWKD